MIRLRTSILTAQMPHTTSSTYPFHPGVGSADSCVPPVLLRGEGMTTDSPMHDPVHGWPSALSLQSSTPTPRGRGGHSNNDVALPNGTNDKLTHRDRSCEGYAVP